MIVLYITITSILQKYLPYLTVINVLYLLCSSCCSFLKHSKSFKWEEAGRIQAHLWSRNFSTLGIERPVEQVPTGNKDKPICFLRDYSCILLNKLSEVLKFPKDEGKAIREAELLNRHRVILKKVFVCLTMRNTTD